MNKIEQSVRERFVSFTRGIKECLIVVTSSIAIATMLTACTPMKLEGKTPTKTPTPTRTPTGIVIKATPTPMPTFTAIGGGKTEITTTVEITSNLTKFLDPYNFYPEYKTQRELLVAIEDAAAYNVQVFIDAGYKLPNDIVFNGKVKFIEEGKKLPEGYSLVVKNALGNSMYIDKDSGTVVYLMGKNYKNTPRADYRDIVLSLQTEDIMKWVFARPEVVAKYGEKLYFIDRVLGYSNCPPGAQPGDACIHTVRRELLP